jgi:uncharacterized protein YdhG (YjbR/CyaY superfamily)
MADKPKSIDEYLAPWSADKRTALEKLRQIIRTIVPEAQEVISYGIPTFRFEGKMVVAFGAAAKHCALYPLSSAQLEAFSEELKDYSTSKGTIRFQPDHPLPDALVRRIVEARIIENRNR